MCGTLDRAILIRVRCTCPRSLELTPYACAFFFSCVVWWALGFVQEQEGYLQGQIGNPDGDDKPNKKFYDPRVWVRKASRQFAGVFPTAKLLAVLANSTPK